MARSNQIVLPIADLVQVSAGVPSGTTSLPGTVRGLLVETAGTLNVTVAGVQHDGVPFVPGITPGFFEEVRSGGTASNVWALS